MTLFPRVAAYHCPQCGAAGELQLGEGEMPCPNCGRHLRTELPAARTEFGPDPRAPIRDGRPPLSFDRLWLARLCVLLFYPIVSIWFIFRQRKMEALVNMILDEMACCRGRGELEELLGQPLYAVSGESCGAVLDDDTQESPDLIECYESDGCCIDLWFKGGRLVEVSGFVKPTVWDVALTRASGWS